MTQMSKASTDGGTIRPRSPDTSPDRPTQPSRLKVLLPTTLPTAMSRSPFSAAARLVATSGMLVPAATMVRPMTRSLTPSALAKFTEACTRKSEPNTSAARPAPISASCTTSRSSQAPASAGLTSAAYSSCAACVSRRDWTTRNTV